ncbi:hypothetical protein AAMO2058_000236100 [Amorphochlora amoebiformis]
MAERPSLHPEGQFVFQEEVKPLAGLVPPMAVPFHRKSTKSILRYSEAFSALVSLWILSGTNYESLSASKNVYMIQTCAVIYFAIAYLCDVHDFQRRYWYIWPIIELSCDLFLTVVGSFSAIHLGMKCLQRTEGIPYCSEMGGILDSWIDPTAAAVTSSLTGMCCAHSVMIDYLRLRKRDFYNY